VSINFLTIVQATPEQREIRREGIAKTAESYLYIQPILLLEDVVQFLELEPAVAFALLAFALFTGCQLE
jgi:hypothetical protein